MRDPGPQLQQVLAFKKEIDQHKTHLVHTFDSTDSFRELIRRHWAAWLRNEEAGHGGAGPPDPAPSGRHLTDALLDIGEDPLQESSNSEFTEKAWSLANAGRLTEAKVEFAKSVAGRQQPQALLEYGRFLRRVGRLDQAKVMLEGALNVAEDQGDDRILATAYAELGTVLTLRGDLNGAEEMDKKALDHAEQLGLSPLIGEIKFPVRTLRRASTKFQKNECLKNPDPSRLNTSS